jgi:hypothetical protein
MIEDSKILVICNNMLDINKKLSEVTACIPAGEGHSEMLRYLIEISLTTTKFIESLNDYVDSKKAN